MFAGHSAFAASTFSYRQEIQQQDTTKLPLGMQQDTSKKGVKAGVEKIEYSAVDSTKYSKDKSIIYLYGKARVIYQSFELDADYISYNSKTNTIFASGRKDKKEEC